MKPVNVIPFFSATSRSRAVYLLFGVAIPSRHRAWTGKLADHSQIEGAQVSVFRFPSRRIHRQV